VVSFCQFPPPNRVCTSHIYHTCYIPYPYHSYLFVQPSNILCVEIINLLVSECYNSIPNRLLTTCTLFLVTRWCSWLRHCDTSRKIAGSIPDGVIGIFQRINHSDRTVALGLAQPLTEMSTIDTYWGVKAAVV
jgi:hypothetical protein